MFNATYFTYDGVYSGQYGLMIADFDDSAVIETAAFSPSLNTIKPSRLNRFLYNGLTYETPPQHPFSIISQYPIEDVMRRKILSWLVAREGFKVLKIHQTDLERYYYRCIFTDIQIIFVNGNCHGFRVTANFDSPYQYGEPVSSGLINGSANIRLYNYSDIPDNYVYPIVKFDAVENTPITLDADNTLSAWIESFNNRNIKCYLDIVNTTDSTTRHFALAGNNPATYLVNKNITIDNEIKHISGGSHGLLKYFNKNWLRLRPGVNELTIKTNGRVEIICPTYVKLGF